MWGRGDILDPLPLEENLIDISHGVKKESDVISTMMPNGLTAIGPHNGRSGAQQPAPQELAGVLKSCDMFLRSAQNSTQLIGEFLNAQK